MSTTVRDERDTGARTRVTRVTAWRPGEAPQAVEQDAPLADGVRLVEVQVIEPRGTRDPDLPERLLPDLNAYCEGQLDVAMVADLLNISDKREGARYHHGEVRSISTFAVEAKRRTRPENGREVADGGELVIQPLELLAGPGWLVAFWHPPRNYRGASAEGPPREPRPPEDLIHAVEARWVRGGGRSSGDLGVMIVHELGLGYRPATFAIRSWVEEWELRLYLEDQLDRGGLERLWGSMATLREWIQPLNRPGMAGDPDKAWFAEVSDDRLLVEADDKCVDRALMELRDLADVLRADFNVMSARLLEEQRERREQLQRRVEIGAAAFLVPTLIVGFYGANTELPGGGTWWGFWVMVVVLVTLSAVAVAAVWAWQRKDRAAEAGRAERREDAV